MKETKCDVLNFELVYGVIPESVVTAYAKMLFEVGSTFNNLIK